MSVSVKTEKKLTPLMEQYRAIHKTLPSDTILFFRLGDFYEMFFEDAVRASEILDITLTGRGGGASERIPMCGFPYHAFQGYVKTLIESNLKVAIAEQVGDVKPGKGLVERKITRIVTPATFLDDETDRKHFDYMLCIAETPKAGRVDYEASYAISYLEISTGEFFIREVPEDRLLGEIALLAPREIIVSKKLAAQKTLHAFLKDELNATITVYEDWIFESEEAFKLIVDNFKLASESAIQFHDHAAAVIAVGGILYYLRDHLHSSLEHVRMPVLIQSRDYMVLDRQTQKSLELVHSMSGKKDGPTLIRTIDQTMTSMGGRTLYQWVTHPLVSLTEILKRQEAVSEMSVKQDPLHALRGCFKGIRDMERALSRLNYGVANARDLLNLRLFLERVPLMQDVLQAFETDLIKESATDLKTFEDIKDLVKSAIVEEPPLSLKDGGIIRDGYNGELDELRSISKNGKSWILEFEKRESERTGIKSLKVKYSGVFGYAIEVSKANLNLVPDDYVRRQTLANAERFIVPELKSWDEKISGAQDKIKTLEYKIFNEVREKILESLEALQNMAKAVGFFDALSSVSLTSVQQGWVRPELDESNDLDIKAGRHPVVESMIPSGEFVENDVLLDGIENQLVVLTGPNMAGKSTYIRQVAQIVLLAQMGSYVPADHAKLGIVDRIFTRIGATDDLARGESTFMVEMLETAHILNAATSKSLLVLDEVGRGTSTFDGVSIAWAICEYLVKGKEKPRTLFATHYHELTQLEEHCDRIKNYNITVKETEDGITFLRKVVRGGSDRSYGIHVARLAGLPETLTRRANEILEVLESENTEATQIIEGKPASDVKKKKKTKPEDLQPTLFDVKIAEHPLIDKIKKLDINELTPLDALNQIAAWKKHLKDEENKG